MRENVPGSFPYTAGVFAFKRENEDPTRMFAGEGDAFRTNKRFQLLSKDMPAKRLSTAFDSVTLYGFDPDERPDIYGKVGNSGVSIATLDDMKVLYDGFDLCAPNTSVSMTINGPAPTILAMFFNTAIDQQLEKFSATTAASPPRTRPRRSANGRCQRARHGAGRHPEGGPGAEHLHLLHRVLAEGDGRHPGVLHRPRRAQLLLGVDLRLSHRRGRREPDQPARLHARQRLHLRRGLPRARHAHRRLRAQPVVLLQQRHGPEYTVLGRVARRIWAVAMRERYGADERSQKLKYHIQTSGRSLHAQEIAFNDIRTTLQALIATYDNCNSLHTNAYDEAITTPTEESVRRAMAIQLIINREWGLAKNENPNQGSVHHRGADRPRRGGGARGVRGDQRARRRAGRDGDRLPARQDPGRVAAYEHKKHDGSYPIIGVNTFRNPHGDPVPAKLELIRSTEEEKQSQLKRLREFHARNAKEAPAMLERLRQAVIDDENVFAVLMDAVRVCSLGQITHALFEVGGQYRRSM
jgi:isobutyryl-CoA mutase